MSSGSHQLRHLNGLLAFTTKARSKSNEQINSSPTQNLVDSCSRSHSFRDLTSTEAVIPEFRPLKTPCVVGTSPSQAEGLEERIRTYSVSRGYRKQIMSLIVTPPSKSTSPTFVMPQSGSPHSPVVASSSANDAALEKLEKTLQKVKMQLEELTAQRKDMEKRVERVTQGIQDVYFQYGSHRGTIGRCNTSSVYDESDYTLYGDLYYGEDLSSDEVFVDSSPHDVDAGPEGASIKTAHYKLKMSASSTPPTSPLVQQHKKAERPQTTTSESGTSAAEGSKKRKKSSKGRRCTVRETPAQPEQSPTAVRRASFLVRKLSSHFSKRKSKSSHSQEGNFDI